MKGRSLLAATLLAMAMSCSSSEDNSMLDSKPDFVGFVTTVQTGEPRELIVESHANKEVARHRVLIPREATYLRREGATTRPLDPATIREKDWVEIWFAGAADSSGRQRVRQLIVTDRPG